MSINNCNQCGKCCLMEIPVTLLDIHRMAEFMEFSESHIFTEFIDSNLSERTKLFRIKKKEDGFCILLNKNECKIHQFKPNVCQLYYCKSCEKSGKKNILNCSFTDHKTKLWEQAIATEITRKYIYKNGIKWNENDYKNALSGILKNIKTNERQKIKLARNQNNDPVGIIYDCSTCEERGTQAEETLVTLVDIDRIIKQTKTTWEDFFMTKLDNSISKSSGIYKLKRDPYCVFFDKETHCNLKEMQPLHCKFTPCPKKINNLEAFDCFYLGAGSIEEQYKHQVAIYITQEYIRNNRFSVNHNEIKSLLNMKDNIVNNKKGFKEFCESIEKFRFINDTDLLNVMTHEKN